MRVLSLLFALLFVSTGNLAGQEVERFRSHAGYLASDELNGRGTGSSEIRLAARYIADQFESIGLEPASGDSYFQWFPVPNHLGNESNVIGIVPATMSTDRSIVFTAHYDAYGVIGAEGTGDVIHNGARDNAIGVAALIELARRFKESGPPPMNLVFVATAAEELGGFGSRYYVDNPAFPLDDVVINLNIDGFNVSGPREDFFLMPRQGVDFIDEIEAVAAELGWIYAPPDWVDGMNTSFDTAAFLGRGIPAVTMWTGDRLKSGEVTEPPRLGRIHTPEDEISDLWNWDGVEAHLSLYEAIARYFMEHTDGISVTDSALFTR